MVLAHGVAADGVAAEPGGQGAGGAVRELLAGDHQQAGARVASPQRGEHRGARGLCHGERCVVAGVEGAQQGLQLRRAQELARDAVDSSMG